MSESVIKEEKEDSSVVNLEGEILLDINDYNDSSAHSRLLPQISQDPLSIFSLLIDIKEQLNTIQQDVNDLKRKINDVGEQTSSKLIKIDSNTTGLNARLEKVDKSFASILNQKGVGTNVQKPDDFPESILHDNFQDFERFDDLLHDFDGPYALYYTEIIKEKLKNCQEFKRFLRSGFSLLMTRELQYQCSYTGRGGYGVNNLNSVILLQATCRMKFSVNDSEVIKKYCMDYFSNVKSNYKHKSKTKILDQQQIIEVRDEPEDLMDIGDYSI